MKREKQTEGERRFKRETARLRGRNREKGRKIGGEREKGRMLTFVQAIQLNYCCSPVLYQYLRAAGGASRGAVVLVRRMQYIGCRVRVCGRCLIHTLPNVHAVLICKQTQNSTYE